MPTHLESGLVVMSPSVGSRCQFVKRNGPCISDAGQACPFKFFHSCKFGISSSSRLLAHLKRDHLGWDDGKEALRNAISEDLGLFGDVVEALQNINQWLCGRCMALHALSRGCHHEDGVAKFLRNVDGKGEFIIGIPKPCQPIVEPAAEPDIGSKLVVDISLLERLFAMPITTVKSIPRLVD
ncbi:hypothetical protein CTI12_AA025070 [Artemisia annua]|uniref:Uncharacterized protein n=1 Tax=Artemisia annua TaxID=35608 RepID=A0A2U1QIJ6_ARTAN|nr:hypothetical protein CTI12_AA025070 [Artemisia annua]